MALCALSCLFSFLFILAARHLLDRRGQKDLHAVQSAHDVIVPRLGGLAVFVTFLLFLVALNLRPFEQIFLNDFYIGNLYFLLVSVFPVFIVGLAEDLGFSMSPFVRLLASTFSGILVIWFFEVWVNSLGIPIVDILLSFGLVGIIFTLFATSGVVNAFNLIDGLNGLAGFTGIFVAFSLSYIAFETNQIEVLRLLFIFSACISGFMLFNFPIGKIFLGDGGAYTIGHTLVWSAIILVNNSPEISPFSILLIFFWPIADTFLAIWRRWKQKKRPDQPDRLHFHQLVMRFIEIRFFGRAKRRLANPVATVILLPFVMFPQIIGVVFWNNFSISLWSVVIMTALFLTTYLLSIKIAKRL